MAIMEDSKRSQWDRIKAAYKSFKTAGISKKQPKAELSSGGTYNHLFSWSYNGEKNLGEIGPIKNYRIDYYMLQLRSWQSYLESEITQTVINRFATWVIGKGLKLQAEPAKDILKEEGIELDAQKFCASVEGRFNIYRKSKYSDYSSMANLDLIANKAFKNSIIGGDVLVILRYINNNLTIQLIDGAHVQSPVYGTEFYPQQLDNGNSIMNGIEINSKREIIAFYVRSVQNPLDAYRIVRVPAKQEGSELSTAFMVYGMDYRLDNIRGLPLISTVLETLKKLERYKEATVGSAEERQKIPYTIKHGLGSTGESPLNKNLAKAYDVDAPVNDDLPRDVQGKLLANTIAVSTNKQVFNMPIDSELQALESKNELHFKDFYTVNIDLICAALGIPPNVAMSKYDSNFSASRAALKDWEHTLGVTRSRFQFQFYQPIYNFWLEVQIFQNKISAPGYLQASIKGDDFILGAYRNARFVGAPVPHIDPLKEVNAERAKLGMTAEAIPLTTVEAATEALNGGESDSNMEQYAKELLRSKELKIEAPVKLPTVPVPQTD